MPLIGFTVRLGRIEENLLYRAKDGSFWLSCVCSFDEDAKGRTIVAQSIPRERYAAGERGPQVGFWREIGKPKPPASDGKGFDLAKYKAAAQAQRPGNNKYPQSEESLFPSPESAFDAAKETRREPQAGKPPGFDEPGL